MARIVGQQVVLDNGKAQNLKEGEWYDGQRYLGGKLLAKGEYEEGKVTSDAVNQQSSIAQGKDQNAIKTYLGQNSVSGAGATTYASPSADNSAFNLTGLYDKYYSESGVQDLLTKAADVQKEIDQKNLEVTTAQKTINENPWYTEGARVGSSQKLTLDADRKIQALAAQKGTYIDQATAAKTDINNKLALATQQYNIDQQRLSTSLTQFNSLLGMGALSKASTSDIASFAASTGLPTSFIQNAIAYSNKKTGTGETKMIESTDDKGNVTVSLVQIKNGKMAVVGSQSLGQVSKTNSTATKNEAVSISTQILEAQKNSSGHVSPEAFNEARAAAQQSGLTADEFNRNFAQYTDPNRDDFASTYGFDIKSRGASQYQIVTQQ